jgi:putative ABC transport system substrate-binding protein
LFHSHQTISESDAVDVGEIERALAACARVSNGGLIVTASSLAVMHRELITKLAAKHRLPAVYHSSYYVSRRALG